MEFTVIKAGALMFDAVHAYGLALFLALVTQSSVAITDEGYCFRLRSSKIALQLEVEQCIRGLLEIPSADALRACKESLEYPASAVSNLDGLLAVLFTSPGVRTVSVQDVFGKEVSNPTALERSLAKATSAVERWTKDVARMVRRQFDSVLHLLNSYSADQPAMPTPIIKGRGLISIPMTIDPMFSYSTRRPISDGMIADKTNVSLSDAPYAPMLGIIGATRFLRAQRVAENLVMFYLPIAESLTLLPEIALPLLHPSAQSADYTLTQQWLERAWVQAVPEARWTGLAYQVLQTQGAQQSISRSCGYLDYAWLEAIEQRVGPAVTRRWLNLLRARREH